MKYFLSNDPPTTLVDSQIESVLEEMTVQGVTSEEYPTLLRHLERLNDIRLQGRRTPVSLDTVVSTIGSFLQVFMIVGYERQHVMTTKALGQIIRPRT